MGRMLTSLVCLVVLAGIQTASADNNPPTCSFSLASVALGTFCSTDGTNGVQSINGQAVVPGQTIYYQANVSQNNDANCGFQGGTITITTPDGVAHDVTPTGGVPLICGSPGCNPAGSALVLSKVAAYTVRPQDVGVNQAGFLACPGTNVQCTVTYSGGTSFCDAANDCDPSAQTSVCNPARTPRLVVTKLVSCSTGTVCDASLTYGASAAGASDSDSTPSFCYSITFTNTGTAALTITSVVDNVMGDLTGLSPSGLLAGHGTTIYVPLSPTNLTQTTQNTVTVLGFEAASCSHQPISTNSSATADVVATAISCEVRFVQNGQLVTGNVCPGSTSDLGILPSGNPVQVVVRVTNTAGNGQSIVDGTVTVGSVVSNVPGPIAVGGFVDVVVSNITGSALGTYSFNADVVFNGSDTGSCPPVNTSCSKSLDICGSPKICIVKLVKCMGDTSPEGECETGECSTDLTQYAPSATGVKDAGFCYGIIVSNCGQLTLTNVNVDDTQLGNNLTFPDLAPGQAATNFYQKSYPGVLGDVRNTATAQGESAGGSVTASTNALVTLLDLGIICSKTVSVNGGDPSAGGTVVVTPNASNDLAFAVNVLNNGDVDLVNVKVIDTGTSGCPPSTNTIASLAAGASTNIVLCTITGVVCPPGGTLSNIVTVSAEVSSDVCSINPENCQRISVSSACTNVITLTCETPGCRTTGGGKQLASENQVCPTDARYVTHGGQVGAPFGAASAPTLTDCTTGAGFGFNNPCIWGEYTHVRHIKSGLVGNFHAAGNGNVSEFDSLQCACLPCDSFTEFPSSAGGCHPADRVYNSPGDLIDGLCNHTDPRSVCGPEPRKAPANKIAFTGVGDYTFTKGKRSPQSVVFRVDLEDRSEPGGAHPKGGKAPPDRYRMRMWFITGDPDSAANRRLREAVAVKDATDERVGTKFGGTFQPGLLCNGGSIPAPDIDDGGDLDRGNRQIHPNTGASCKN